MANTLPFGLQTTLPGTKFLPSKKKLVSFYLSNKILGQSETEAVFIPDCDLYGHQEPWEIFKLYAPDPVYFDDDDDDDAVKDVYCFTRLKKISKNRIRRTVGKGTWHAEGKPEDYKVKVSGKFCDACYKRYLYRNEDDSENHKRWSLLEFSCCALSDDVVICILRKNEAKGARRGTSVHVPVLVDACPTLKRKSSDVCQIATEEPKRMRFEAECIVKSPTNANSEICPAISSPTTVDPTTTCMVPSYTGSNLSDWADSCSHQEDNYCYGMMPDGEAIFTNLLLDQNNIENGGDGSSNTSSIKYVTESQLNYNSQISDDAHDSEELEAEGGDRFADLLEVLLDQNNIENGGDGSSNTSSIKYVAESQLNYNSQISDDAHDSEELEAQGGDRFADLLEVLLDQNDIENGDQDSLDEMSSSPLISYFDLWC